MKRLDAHFPIDDGHRVVCLAGCGISTLASSIQSWFPDRESHSILGSTFLNPTTAAVSSFYDIISIYSLIIMNLSSNQNGTYINAIYIIL